MNNKISNAGQLLSQLNKNIDKNHHKKQNNQAINQIDQKTPNQTQIKIDQNNKTISQKQLNQTLQNQINKNKYQAKNKKEQKISEKIQNQNNSTTSQRKITNNDNIQNITVRSNLSKANQLKNKKNAFKESFSQSQTNIIQQQQLGQDLNQILALQIGKLISEPLAEVIESVMKQRQNTIYIAYTKGQKYYLEKLLQFQKEKQGNSLQDIQKLLINRQLKTMQKLQNGQLFIDHQRSIKSKSQIQKLQQLDVARLLKIKQGKIRSKLDLLNDKMFQFQSLQQKEAQNLKQQQQLLKYQELKIQQINNPNNFSLNSQKTKIAIDYINHLKQQKLVQLKKRRQRQQKKQKNQLQRSQQIKQAQQLRNLAKKQQINQKIKQFKTKKQKEKQQKMQKDKKVAQFLTNYRKSLPLYVKKQKQFYYRYEKNQQQQRLQKLKQIKENKRSFSYNELKQHQQKYLTKRQKQQQKRQEQFKMMLNAKKAMENQKNYFKGFYHQKVKIWDQQDKLKVYSLRESTKLKIQRITQFDNRIRKLYKPKIDQQKKEALQNAIELQILKKKKVKKLFKQVNSQNGQVKLQAYYEQIPQKNIYKEGNKYMQISKSLAKKTKPQQNYKTSEQLEVNQELLEEKKLSKSRISNNLQSPSKIINQEKDIWKLRGKQIHQMTQDINPTRFYQIKKNLQIMDQKANKREQLLKHKQSNINQIMQQKGMLDQFYLESIKNKIKLLNE